ncbi:MAG: RimK family alpha-L-glutamate ligase [Rhodospirillales bacterium]|nr:RimK family alpha-L-glutamate ligase [Rhodospirillales bacterium]
MKTDIWILEYLKTASKASHESVALIENELRARGENPVLIDLDDLDVLVSPAETVFYHKGQALALPACAIPRTGSATDHRAVLLFKTLVQQGVILLNQPEAIETAADKAATMALLAAAGIPVPKTILPARPCRPDVILEQLGMPIVVKRPSSSGGAGVFLFTTPDDFRNFMNYAGSDGSPGLIFQEFIGASAGRDMRVIVINGKAVRALIRTAAHKGEFRANLGLGGSATFVETIPPEIAALCVKAAAVAGLDMVGVDVLFGTQGQSLICEINSAFHINSKIQTDERYGVPVHKLIADFALSSVEKIFPARTGARA